MGEVGTVGEIFEKNLLEMLTTSTEFEAAKQMLNRERSRKYSDWRCRERRFAGRAETGGGARIERSGDDDRGV